MSSSIVYDIRLPKDPPRTYDVSRVTLQHLLDVTSIQDIDAAMTSICRLVGLADYKSMLSHECSEYSWATGSERQRICWTVLWLLRENNRRSTECCKK